MYHINLLAAWIGILIGFIYGAVSGLFFHKEDWMGGYQSFRRRMLRLGHVSFFGIALINFFFFYTCNFLHLPGARFSSILFIIGAVTMPLICILTAAYQKFKHLFFIPVLSLVTGTIVFIVNNLI